MIIKHESINSFLKENLLNPEESRGCSENDYIYNLQKNELFFKKSELTSKIKEITFVINDRLRMLNQDVVSNAIYKLEEYDDYSFILKKNM